MTQHLLHRETPSSSLVTRPDVRADVRAEVRAEARDGLRADVRARDEASWVARFVRNLAFQDWFIGTYFCIMMLALAFGSGPDRETCIVRVGVDIVLFWAGLALTRGEILKPGSYVSSLLYRVTLFLAVFLSYFQLRHILPAVSSRAIDADIFAFDLRTFGIEPALAWDRFVTPTTTEWFAFFYFGYFFLLAIHVFPIMLAARDSFRLSHFAMGIFIVFCCGHLIYMIVPGYGPYRYLAPAFHHELSGGIFWEWVKATVQAGGAQKDIFPSLHTAAPTFLALYSFRHRAAVPFKYTWPVIAFCASQIICATMFLRWHYLVDICAGLTLATTAVVVGEKIVVWDNAIRARKNAEQPASVQPIFYLLDYRWLLPRGARASRPSEKHAA